MATWEEFAQKIKQTYPGQYDDVDNSTLAKRMLEVHPEYQDRVDTTGLGSRTVAPNLVAKKPIEASAPKPPEDPGMADIVDENGNQITPADADVLMSQLKLLQLQKQTGQSYDISATRASAAHDPDFDRDVQAFLDQYNENKPGASPTFQDFVLKKAGKGGQSTLGMLASAVNQGIGATPNSLGGLAPDSGFSSDPSEWIPQLVRKGLTSLPLLGTDYPEQYARAVENYRKLKAPDNFKATPTPTGMMPGLQSDPDVQRGMQYASVARKGVADLAGEAMIDPFGAATSFAKGMLDPDNLGTTIATLPAAGVGGGVAKWLTGGGEVAGFLGSELAGTAANAVASGMQSGQWDPQDAMLGAFQGAAISPLSHAFNAVTGSSPTGATTAEAPQPSLRLQEANDAILASGLKGHEAAANLPEVRSILEQSPVDPDEFTKTEFQQMLDNPDLAEVKQKYLGGLTPAEQEAYDRNPIAFFQKRVQFAKPDVVDASSQPKVLTDAQAKAARTNALPDDVSTEQLASMKPADVKRVVSAHDDLTQSGADMTGLHEDFGNIHTGTSAVMEAKAQMAEQNAAALKEQGAAQEVQDQANAEATAARTAADAQAASTQDYKSSKAMLNYVDPTNTDVPGPRNAIFDMDAPSVLKMAQAANRDMMTGDPSGQQSLARALGASGGDANAISVAQTASAQIMRIEANADLPQRLKNKSVQEILQGAKDAILPSADDAAKRPVAPGNPPLDGSVQPAPETAQPGQVPSLQSMAPEPPSVTPQDIQPPPGTHVEEMVKMLPENVDQLPAPEKTKAVKEVSKVAMEDPASIQKLVEEGLNPAIAQNLQSSAVPVHNQAVKMFHEWMEQNAGKLKESFR